MSTQTVNAVPTVEWDDSAVFVFSFSAGGSKLFSGFVHAQLQVAVAAGSAVQVSQILQVINQTQIQFALDPQAWIDTLKTAARGNSAINITFDDATTSVYTTFTNQSFTLQQLFSLAG